MQLNASDADRWMACPSAGIQSEPGVEIPKSDDAREGTCAAWLADRMLKGDVSSAFNAIGDRHLNGWKIDADMARHVQGFVDMIRQRYESGFDGTIPRRTTLPLRSEFSVTAQDGSVILRARMDALSDLRDTIFIDDFKFGYVIVPPTTWQLFASWMALVETFPEMRRCNNVVLGIYQPRAIKPDGPYSSVTYHTKDLLPIEEMIRRRMRHIENIASGKVEPYQVPGPHCNNCPRAANCSALASVVYRIRDEIDNRPFIKPTNQQIGDEMLMLDVAFELIKIRRKAIEAEIKARIANGQAIPGWAMMPTYGKRSFTVDADMLEGFTCVDPIDRKLCTPAELERRGVRKSIVDLFVDHPFTGNKLKRIEPGEIDKFFTTNPKGK